MYFFVDLTVVSIAITVCVQAVHMRMQSKARAIPILPLQINDAIANVIAPLTRRWLSTL